MSKVQPLVIEFLGLPGSGKTTVAQVVSEELSKAGYHCFSLSTVASPERIRKKKGGLVQKLRTLYGLILSSVVYRDITANACSYALQVRPLRMATIQRLITFLIRLDFFRTVINENFDMVVLDQGSLQNIWSIATTGATSDGDNRLKQLTESVLRKFSPLVVMVCIEVEDAAERISHRSTMRSRFDEMSLEQVQTMLTQHNHVFSQITDVAMKFQRSRYLEVDGKQSPDQSVNRIVPFIKSALMSEN